MHWHWVAMEDEAMGKDQRRMAMSEPLTQASAWRRAYWLGAMFLRRPLVDDSKGVSSDEGRIGSRQHATKIDHDPGWISTSSPAVVRIGFCC